MIKPNIIISVLISLCWLSLKAQDVTNADYYEKDKKVYITYSLNKEADISLYISVNGAPFERISIYHLEGDIGSNVKAGKNKIIVWDVLTDRERLVGNVQFKLAASESLNNFTKRVKKEKNNTTKYSANSNFKYRCDRFYSNAGSANIAFFEIGAGVTIKKGIGIPIYMSAFSFRYKMLELALATFSYDIMSLTGETPLYGFYWKPQARVVVPINDNFAFISSAGPSLRLNAADWWFLVNARIRYVSEILDGSYFDFLAGYEDQGFVIGFSLTYSFSVY